MKTPRAPAMPLAMKAPRSSAANMRGFSVRRPRAMRCACNAIWLPSARVAPLPDQPEADRVTHDILQIEGDGAIHRVTLNRPERLNALNQALTEKLLAYFEARRRDNSVRVVILRGAGRGFPAGADLKAAGTPEALRDGHEGDWYLRDLMKAMRAC